MKVSSKLKREFLEVFATVHSYNQAFRLGACASPLFAMSPALAQGFINGFQNLNTLAQAAIGLLILLGVLGGLGFILGACFSLYKKYDRGNDDIGWGKIGIQLAAGGLGMALSWVGVQIVETLGGSEADIGRQLN